ncbi:hypothetical protein SALWKB12_1579 [Snodgrassella communis]|nr:hypothetical protein SALWKB12_1579 [Snodgrassella communis]
MAGVVHIYIDADGFYVCIPLIVWQVQKQFELQLLSTQIQ